MKAFILAAGLGTRLRPWTLQHPKALVPVGGIPMLERVIIQLKSQGFDEMVVNVHHFGDQIIDFLNNKEFGVRIAISDEREKLLDTGGAILHARQLLCLDNTPFLVHNVDILSDADLGELMRIHEVNERVGVMSTLMVSQRNSSRKLIFDKAEMLCGWHNLKENSYKPEGILEKIAKDIDHEEVGDFQEKAFSGIHVMSPGMVDLMTEQGMSGAFSIIDFLLGVSSKKIVKGYYSQHLSLIDIGKPETLTKANNLFEVN